MPRFEVIIPLEYTVEVEAENTMQARLTAEVRAEEFRLANREPGQYGPLYYMDRDIEVHEIPDAAS